MRILYGVQATGNGHITRARVMAPALEDAGIKVDYLFSGRRAEELFNMEPFGEYQTRQGLTFILRDGRVKVWDTVRSNNVLRCWRDARRLDLSSYDRVVTDFEPITAWAARCQGVPCVGIAHQYALVYPMPGHNQQLLSGLVNLFTPTDTAIGVHWHHFNAPISPPLIQPSRFPSTLEPDKILVYLPAHSVKELEAHFTPFGDYRFYIYCGIDTPRQSQNLYFLPYSRDGFQQDLESCSGVITNSGFGLISEAIQYGKKIFSIPIKRQVEQISNARVLDHLGLAFVVDDYDQIAMQNWLAMMQPSPHCFPNVAAELAQWIADDCRESPSELTRRLWDGCTLSVS